MLLVAVHAVDGERCESSRTYGPASRRGAHHQQRCGGQLTTNVGVDRTRRRHAWLAARLNPGEVGCREPRKVHASGFLGGRFGRSGVNGGAASLFHSSVRSSTHLVAWTIAARWFVKPGGQKAAMAAYKDD